MQALEAMHAREVAVLTTRLAQCERELQDLKDECAVEKEEATASHSRVSK